MQQQLWQQRVEEAAAGPLTSRVFAAFNINVDVVVHVRQPLIDTLLQAPGVQVERLLERSILEIETLQSCEDLALVLLDRMVKGKSFHVTVEGQQVPAWLGEHVEPEERLLGGQAGIIANQMAALGAISALWTPLLSETQSALVAPDVLVPVVRKDRLELVPVAQAVRPLPTKINWILEFPKGAVYHFGPRAVETPRANRVIVATRPREAVMAFSEELRPHLPELGSRFDVAFMAGYHYGPPDRSEDQQATAFYEQSSRDLRALRSANRGLRVHFEYVPMKRDEWEVPALKAILQEAKSFGINENEIKRVLRAFGYEQVYQEVLDREGSPSLYRGALALLRELGLERIQVHNLGYYVVLLRKPYPVPPAWVRRACLFASAVNGAKARYGGFPGRGRVMEASRWPLAEAGFEQLARFEREVLAPGGGRPVGGPFAEEGIAEFEDHYALVVPAHVVANPVSTVGMGDTVSSASYAMEVGGHKAVAAGGAASR